MPGEAPPQMIEIDAVGAIASLWLNRSSMPNSAASGQAPRSKALAKERGVALAADMLEHLLVPHLRHHRFERDVVLLQEGVETHDTEPDRALAHGGIGGAGEVRAGIVDEALQDVVEEAHHVLDEGRMLVPFEIGLEVERRKAAHRGALL